MAEANLIPGATQLFADVLEGGDVKKLFDNMKKGKYELQDIVKVLEMLGKKLDQDLLDKMLQRPTAELAELQTAVQRFFQTLNESGGLTLMKKGLDAVTWAVNGLTKVIKPLFGFIGDLFDSLSPLLSLLWDIGKYAVPLGAGIFILAGRFGMLSAALIQAGLLTKYAKGLAALRAVMMSFLVWPLAIAGALLLLIEVIDTALGKDTLWTRLAEQKDKGLLGWLAAVSKSVLDLLGLIGSVSFNRLMWAYGKLTGDQEMVDNANVWLQDDTKGFKEKQNKMDNPLQRMNLSKAMTLGGGSPFATVAVAGFNFLTSPEAPAKSIQQNFSKPPMMGQGMLTPPQLNVDLTIQAGDIGDPQKVADIAMGTLRKELPMMYTQYYSDYVTNRVPR